MLYYITAQVLRFFIYNTVNLCLIYVYLQFKQSKHNFSKIRRWDIFMKITLNNYVFTNKN